MGLCSRPGGGPNAWKHFGPELDPGMRALHKAPGQRGILGRGLRGGVPGRPPFWRTLVSPTERWGWTQVSLKINTRHRRVVSLAPRFRSAVSLIPLVENLVQDTRCTLPVSALSLDACLSALTRFHFLTRYFKWHHIRLAPEWQLDGSWMAPECQHLWMAPQCQRNAS